ncbi:uncharacterized protein M6B38_181780 [Iris pallida]|uniref:CCHC-type domain-containing protein n=1 Tax=Iris pallida TaxID=29817 RepID=A0AAX6EM97_IRIPA|nr:uncharacterized protein M6B38_181780 [Iris pallida]
MMALLQQMLQTQRVQEEAQHHQAEMFRQSIENSHRQMMVALERVVPGTVQDTPVQHQCQRQRPAARCHFCGRPGHTREACRKRLGVCLYCGAPDHQLKDCRSRGVRGVQDRAQPARGPAVQQRGPPLQTQQQHFQQHQRGAPADRVHQALARDDQQQGQGKRQVVQCAFCKKIGYTRDICRMKLGVCLFCGAPDPQMRDCAARTARQAGQDRVRQARGGQQGRAFVMAVEPSQAVAEQSADDLEDDCPTYYGIESEGVDLDRGLVVEPLDFAHPE